MMVEDYEKYYQKGGTYVIPVEVFNEIFNEMKNWKQENQELKKQLEDMTLCRDIASGHRKEVQDRETILLKENEKYKEVIDKLKSLLNDYEMQNDEVINVYCKEIREVVLKEV